MIYIFCTCTTENICYVFGFFQELDVFAFQVLNGVGDLLDLVSALNPESIPDWKSFTHDEARLYVQKKGFCSALIKVNNLNYIYAF